MQIPMAQMEIEALRGQVRVISHDVQGIYAGKDEYTARKNELGVLLDECAQKLHASMEEESRISEQVANWSRNVRTRRRV